MPSPKSAISNRRKRILIRAANWIGDNVMTMPAVQRLRELEPAAELTVLCPAKLADLWRHNPHLAETIGFTNTVDTALLRERKFDVAIIFPNSFRSAWECRRARIPVRIGFPGHWRRGLLTDVVPEAPDERPVYQDLVVDGHPVRRKHFGSLRHQMHRYLDIIGFLGGNREPVAPRIWAAPAELPSLNKFFQPDSRPSIAVNVGAEFGPAKRWPLARFAAAAAAVEHEFGCRWLLLGGPGDVDINHLFAHQLALAGIAEHSIVNLAGRTTLMEVFGLMKVSRVVLTNDTGPMHIAAALGRPVVAVFGSTSPELTGPIGPHCTVVRHRVECSPCFLRECPIDFRCMERVTVAEVANAVMKHLSA